MGNFIAAVYADRHVLVGRIVTRDAKGTVHARGAVCIEADRIAAVVANPAHVPDAFAGITAVDTGGTIYPGLIELHNHLSYNFLPIWTVPKTYTNRNQWREKEPDYPISVSLPAKVIGGNADIDYPRSIARFVECRSLLGGTTTTQGLSASGSGGKKWYRGLTRNVEAPRDPAFPAATGQTLDYAPTIDFEMEEEEDFTAGRDALQGTCPEADADGANHGYRRSGFIPALKANINLPAYLKQAL